MSTRWPGARTAASSCATASWSANETSANDTEAETLLAGGHAHGLARDACPAREVPLRGAVGGHRRRVAHRSPRLQYFLPPRAVGRGAHPDGWRSDGARVLPADPGTGSGAP